MQMKVIAMVIDFTTENCQCYKPSTKCLMKPFILVIK